MKVLLKKFDFYVSKFEEYVIAWSILLMFIVLTVNVILRFLFSKSLVFSEELGQILVATTTFFGLGLVTRRGQHIRMSTLYDYSNTTIRKALALLTSFVTSGALFWMSYITFKYAQTVKFTGRVTPTLHIPVYITVAIVAIGMLSAAIQFACIFYLNLTGKDTYIGNTPDCKQN
ncbi:TRAP transporter small permease [Cloacibacillus porcorum]|uniref:TRAP transporter small permease n=1 Tax=Cloacibacillus porcorum TaxID=1197717 RepID=UPI001459F91F|nr:TRAP transporter small permease [Cloacibacillus porcorum]MCC8184687.1 TRAP transporter small permease [Cloacibacillus porcorum]MDY5389557.1 TRAP transporter small permease [Cloacibacillus porcorum]NMF18818.1 TRAP transporter small permease [Cloacibacillus porcorum]